MTLIYENPANDDYQGRNVGLDGHAIKLRGNSDTPDSTAVTVLRYDSSDNVVEAQGATIPSAESGYAVMARFYDTTNKKVYVNTGTTSSCTFTELPKSGSISNSMLSLPRVTFYTEVCPVGAFTDGGGASGTLALATTIPAGAVFLNSLVTNITGFAGDTSAVLTIGDGSDVDRYNTGTPDVFSTSAAGVAMGAPSGTAWHSANATPTLTITGASDFTSIVTEGNGTLTVTLAYIQPA